MAWTLDKVKAERQRAERIQPRTSVSQAQVDAAAQATMSQNQIAPTGGSLVEKATSSVGLVTDNRQFTATKPRYTEVELPGVRNNAQRIADRQKNRVSVDDRLAELYEKLENTPVSDNLNDSTRYNLAQEIRQLEKQKAEAEKSKDGKQSVGKTVFDVVDRGAGYFNQGVANTADFVANLLPRAEGAFFGVDPEATFTGQVLKPVTNATGKLKDWVDKEVEGIDARIQNDTKDSKVAQTAANLGSQAVSILPNTLMALMSGGTSVAGQLATQGSGIATTTTSALQKMASNPMYWTSAAQSLGNNYEEAKASGATDEEAMTAALLSTAFNSAVEVGGGLEKLPDELIGADLSNGQKALQWLKSTLLEEPGEEVVQDVISGLTNAAVFDKDKPMFSMTDENAVINPQRMGKTYLESAAVSGIMGGGQVLASNAINQLASRNANTNAPQQTQTNTPNEDMVSKMAQGIQEDAAAETPDVSSVIEPAAHRQTAAQILNEGIFDSPAYGEALQDTGLKRGDVKQALRDISRGVITAQVDPNVQTVLRTIEGVDAQPTQVQTPVQAETPAAKVEDIMPKPAPAVDVDAALNNVRAEGTDTDGDMGAKTSDFPHEVKESKSKTTPRYYEQYNIPEEGRADNHYTARTWEEARNNARMNLEQDYDGEVESLTRKTTWSDEEVFEAEAILADLRQKAKETNDWSEHQKWSKVFSQHKEELGRAFSALRGLGKNTAETILADASTSLENAVKGTDTNAIMREVDRYAEQYDTAVKNKDVDGLVKIIRDTSAIRKTDTRKGGLSKEIDWALKRVAEYARAEAANAKQTGSSEVGRFCDFLQNFAANGVKAIATDKQKVSFGEGYRTIQHNSILSKFTTIMRNIVSNLALDPMDSLAGNLSVPIDIALSKITKTRSVAVDKSWASEAKRKGSMDGLAMALLEVGLDVNSEGKSGKYENVGKRTFHMANGGIPKLISTWEKYSGYAMTATDEFSKGGIEAEVQRGIDKLYEQDKIKDDSLRNAGEQAALYRTLQDETVPSKIVVGARNALNHAHAGDLGLGDVLIKFAKVPANVPARAADFSPAGLVRGVGKLAKVLVDAKNGNLTAAQQASAVKDIGRGITGSGLIVASTALALKGIIHVVSPGGEEENKDKAASEQAQGLKETQINLSALLRAVSGKDAAWQDDDLEVSLGFLTPINANLMAGALIAEDIKEAKKNGEKISVGDVLTDSLEGTVHALLDLPLMDPIKDISYAWQKSDGDNDVEKLLDVGKQAVAGEAASFVPNALKGIAQGLDPYQRDMYTKDDIVGRTLDQVVGGIPGLRNKFLPTKQDVYGNDIENPDPFLNFMNANILPGAITRYKETDTQAALNELSEETGENTMYLSKTLPKYVTVDGNKVDLTNDQQRQFNTSRGDVYDVASAALESNTNFQQFPNDLKIKAYEHAETYAVQMAKDGLDVGYEPDSWASDLANATPEEIGEAMVQKAVKSLVESKAYPNKYDGISQVLNDGIIDEADAAELLPEKQRTGYTEFIQGSDIPMDDYLDVIEYYNGDGIKQEDVKAYIEKGFASNSDRVRVWQCFYSKNTIPDEWQ